MDAEAGEGLRVRWTVKFLSRSSTSVARRAIGLGGRRGLQRWWGHFAVDRDRISG